METGRQNDREWESLDRGGWRIGRERQRTHCTEGREGGEYGGIGTGQGGLVAQNSLTVIHEGMHLHCSSWIGLYFSVFLAMGLKTGT